MKTTEPIYKELTLNSRNLIVPREAYQRELNLARVRKIAAEFDEHIANEPKVSCRNGRYYVFDGQHTIEARKQRNHGQDLPILCKVYYGLTESDEAMLFAQQTGFSYILTAGARIRALIYAGDPKAISFQKITESVGFQLDYTQSRAQKRLACIGTAFDEFEKIGSEKYKEALTILMEAWGGDPDSLRAEAVQGMTRFIDCYYGEYDRKRMIRRLRQYPAIKIYRDGSALTANFPGYKKYVYQVLVMYNGSSVKTALPLKF